MLRLLTINFPVITWTLSIGDAVIIKGDWEFLVPLKKITWSTSYIQDISY